MKVAFACYTIN